MEGDAVDRPVDTLGRAEMGLQVLDFEQRHQIKTSSESRYALFRIMALQALGHSRIERITQAVAEQVDSEHGDGQERGGKENDVGLELPQRPTLRHDVAPGRNGGRRASAE